MTRLGRGLSAEQRFWPRVDKPNDADSCWLWTGSINRNGYGQMYIGTCRADARLVSVHRFSYELHHGAIPDGLQLDHLCRVLLCVNPNHLEPVTQRENILRGDSPSAINSRKTQCIHGHEFTLDNTYIESKTGKRHCRECKRVRDRAYAATQ